MKGKALQFFRIFGSIYLFLNGIVCVVMFIFAAHAYMTSRWSPAFLVFLLPLLGVFSGYWVRNGKYGWWRTLVITVSLAISAAIIFTSIFISPKLEKIKQSKFETNKKVKNLEPEVNHPALKGGALKNQ